MASAWSSRAPPVAYSASAKAMHWFVAAAVIVLLDVGPVMKRLVPEGSLRDNLYDFHQALGALVLIVMVVRLARRMAFGSPAPDASMPPIEQRASLWAQYALYLLLFVTTIIGWAGTNAYGDPVSVFGLFDLPSDCRQGSAPVRSAFRIASPCRNSDRRNRRAPYRGRAHPLARQARWRPAADAARELSPGTSGASPAVKARPFTRGHARGGLFTTAKLTPGQAMLKSPLVKSASTSPLALL